MAILKIKEEKATDWGMIIKLVLILIIIGVLIYVGVNYGDDLEDFLELVGSLGLLWALCALGSGIAGIATFISNFFKGKDDTPENADANEATAKAAADIIEEKGELNDNEQSNLDDTREKLADAFNASPDGEINFKIDSGGNITEFSIEQDATELTGDQVNDLMNVDYDNPDFDVDFS